MILVGLVVALILGGWIGWGRWREEVAFRRSSGGEYADAADITASSAQIQENYAKRMIELDANYANSPRGIPTRIKRFRRGMQERLAFFRVGSGNECFLHPWQRAGRSAELF